MAIISDLSLTILFTHYVYISDEHEGTQKKTFTKWINAQLAKVQCTLTCTVYCLFNYIFVCFLLNSYLFPAKDVHIIMWLQNKGCEVIG